jgi:hypothetical protein
LGIKDSLFQTLLKRKEETKGQRINPSWEILDDRQNPDIPAKIDQNLKICQDSFFENMDAPTGAKRILAYPSSLSPMRMICWLLIVRTPNACAETSIR